MNYQQIADKIIKINSLYFSLIALKSQVNYLNALKNNTKNRIFYGLANINYHFESFDEDYLDNVITKIKAEKTVVEKLLETFSDIDSDDYK